METPETTPTGFRWITRPSGKRDAYWFASKDAVKAGFEPKSLFLRGVAPEDIPERCRQLNNQTAKWLLNAPIDAQMRAHYDGTIQTLIEVYQRHDDSRYHALKASSRYVYEIYSRVLIRLYGKKRIASINGLDITRWHKGWRGEEDRLGAATAMFYVLKAAVTFGMTFGLEGCDRLMLMMSKLRLPKPKPRTQAPDAAAVTLARQAAHRLGRPSAALGYALQFEGSIRAWDVLALDWAMLDRGSMVLTFTPGKTERTSGKRVALDLSEMPMVVAEMSLTPFGGEVGRAGPIVVNESTGRRWTAEAWTDLWGRVRTEAGLDPDLWNRDLRAAGVTEARRAGASTDDAGRVAGHTKAKITAAVYDRDTVEAGRRVSRARAQMRAK